MKIRFRLLLMIFIMLISIGNPVYVSAQNPPYPSSPVIESVTWDFANLVRLAPGSDLWPTTWAADDNIYTSWGDGNGFQGPDAGLGFARIEGDPTGFVGTDLWRRPRNGGKVTGMISIGGVLYAWLNNTQDLPPPAVPNSTQLGWSNDFGVTWNWASWGFPHSGAVVPSSILNFGKDNSGARDNYVYLYGGAWLTANNDIHLIRVPNDQMNTQGSYEFFAGLDGNGGPTWTPNMNSSVAVFSDPNSTAFNGSQLAAVSFNPVIKLYMLTISHGDTGNLGVFDALEPWGPWTTVQYNANWGGYAGQGPLLYYFPTKWISNDGRILWCIFSGYDPPERLLDSFNLVKATLTLKTQPDSIPPVPPEGVKILNVK